MVPLAIGVVVALSACGPARTAVLGVSVDTTGSPLGVLQVCSSHIDQASLVLWEVPQPVTSTSTHHLGEAGSWRSDRPVTDFATWSLSTGTPWTTSEPIALVPRYTYALSGQGLGSDGRTVEGVAAGVAFTLEDVARLQPGQVRYAAVVDGNVTHVITSTDDFRRDACG